MGVDDGNGNGWQEWKRKVLSDIDNLSKNLLDTAVKLGDLCTDVAVLKELRDDVKTLTVSVNGLREDIAVVKTRLSTYGAVSGAIAGVAVAIITAFIMQAIGL
jgi:hypothetical protein